VSSARTRWHWEPGGTGTGVVCDVGRRFVRGRVRVVSVKRQGPRAVWRRTIGAPFTDHSMLRGLASGYLCTGRSLRWGRASPQGTGVQAVMGADKPAPTECKGSQSAECLLLGTPLLVGGDLVPGRVGNLRGPNLRSAFNHVRHGLQHCWIGSPAIRVRVLFLVPQTDGDRFLPVRGNEREFIPEAVLFPKEGNDFLLNRQRKLRNAIRLQLHANCTSKHVNPHGS
jgi:hypothetical protein